MELIFLAILGIASLVLLKETAGYKTASFDTSGGPGIFPRYVIILLLIAIVALIIQKIIKKEYKGFVFLSLFKAERGITIIALVTYLAVLNLLGFVLSTSLFLCFMVNFLYRANHEKSLGSKKNIALRSSFSVVFAIFIQFVFVSLMHVMLPKGILF